MSFNNRAHIARRFQRSIRIDTDLGDLHALDGFICPQSSADTLSSMARHANETGQGAFTWTGPYGSGKSSLAVALGAFLNGDQVLQKRAAKLFGQPLAKVLRKAFPTGSKGWKVLPVVGQRDNPITVIGNALKEAQFIPRRPRGGWTEKHLVTNLLKIAKDEPKTHGGLVLFIDEMGKFLEAAARDGIDVYIFQQLAELASRSNRRFLFIGVLHQAFEEYTYRLSHEMRDEWAKVQGRFIDLPVNAVGEEQIDLISRAIECDRKENKASELSVDVAQLVHQGQSKSAKRLAKTLGDCWPLHPIVACLLGPISRRRFGQNQRSIFGFLNSSEPHGFQDYLCTLKGNALYRPEKLWDYLRTNLEPSILASPDGHRWALATDALERCEAMGGDMFHIHLLKTIAIIDLFKERSGLLPSLKLLKLCCPQKTEKSLQQGLTQLDKWSLTRFKKFQGAYAIFAGSDFDIDQAVRKTLEEIDEIDFTTLQSLAGLQPILAKRHYHKTGSMRWFDISITPVRDLVELVSCFKPENGVIGKFLLALPTEDENEDVVKKLCGQAAEASNKQSGIVVGFSRHSWGVVTLARELLALDKVNNDHPELASDPVARREVSARLAELQARLEFELNKSFDLAEWYHEGCSCKQYSRINLNSLASDLADQYFGKCPKLHNELLNRQKPSSSAIAAQNALLKRMINNEGEEHLGIEGYPAERGLFVSLLESTGLYSKTGEKWCFGIPKKNNDAHRIYPIWNATKRYVEEHKKRPVSILELYEKLWSQPPYGIKEGLIPILSVAFVLSQRKKLAIYREGIFRAHFDDIDVEYLAKSAEMIQLRWMDINDKARRLLSDMAEIVRGLDGKNELKDLEPIDVARGLVAIYEQLPQWSKRTMRLSTNAVKVRDIFKRARDPNRFLFDDIPALLGDKKTIALNTQSIQEIVAIVKDGLQELVQAYPSMLQRLRDMMLDELQVPNLSRQSLLELGDRAINVKELAGDFRLDAFVGRVARYDGSDASLEGIASLAANKPPRDWVDLDMDRATIEIADMAQKFLRAETFTRIKGRPEKRHAMAVIVSMEGKPTPLLEEFDVIDSDRAEINELIKHVSIMLEKIDTNNRSVILAALAELSANYMQKPNKPKRKRKNGAAL